MCIDDIMTFIADDKFLVPFMATVGASFTILLLQFIGSYRKEHKQKIYAVSYMADVCYRLLGSNLILKKHTIEPHIVATKNIIAGDSALLDTMFHSNEFDILTTKAMSFNHLSEEYKVLLGCDDIIMVQLFDLITYLNTTEKNREDLNDFVKHNLKSSHDYYAQPKAKQLDILNTYCDYLKRINHDTNLIINTICKLVVPSIQEYINGKQFILFSTKGVKDLIKQIKQEEAKHSGLIPGDDFLENSRNGGIQNAL